MYFTIQTCRHPPVHCSGRHGSSVYKCTLTKQILVWLKGNTDLYSMIYWINYVFVKYFVKWDKFYPIVQNTNNSTGFGPVFSMATGYSYKFLLLTSSHLTSAHT